MKFIDTINKYQKAILWVTVAILLYLLFAKPCNKGESAELKSLAAKTDSLERAAKLKDERIAELRKDYTKDTAAARREAQDAVNDVKAVRKELLASQQTIYRLSERLTKSKTDTIENFVKVNPSFVEDCDSLALVAVNQQTQIDGYTTEAAEAEKLLKYETQLRDEHIEREKKYSDSLRKDFTEQIAITKRAIEIGKPRGAFFVGVGVMGNEEKIIGGGSVKFAYLTKGDKMYQYSPHFLQLPGMQKAGVYHEITAFFKPFK